MSEIKKQWCATCNDWKEHGTWQHLGANELAAPALLACPFCGSSNVGLPFDDRPCSWATCHDCGADGPMTKVPSDIAAVEGWNRRQANAEVSNAARHGVEAPNSERGGVREH